LILSSGDVVPFEAVSWQHEHMAFRHGESRVQDDSSSAGLLGSFASSEFSVHTQRQSIEGTDQQLQLSKVLNSPLFCIHQTRAAFISHAPLGKVREVYLDARSGLLAFATVTTLTPKSESQERLVPWLTISIESDNEGGAFLWTTTSTRRMKSAPCLTGGADHLSNPEFRSAVYSFYGVHHPTLEPLTPDNTRLVQLDRVIGAKVLSGNFVEHSILDLALDPRTCEVRWAILNDAYTVPMGALAWNPAESAFRLLTGTKHRRIRLSAATICASELSNLLVDCEGVCCGYVEDIFFDVLLGQLDSFAIEHDGIRVLPWSMLLPVASGDRPHLQLTCSLQTVAAAPSLSGATGSSIHNQVFRGRVRAVPYLERVRKGPPDTQSSSRAAV
jgi:hypothetical protein